MDDETREFEIWLRRVDALAKDGNQGARCALWHAFNLLAWRLATLAKAQPSSVDSELLQGVFQHCLFILRSGLITRNSQALTYTYLLALETIGLINQTAKREPDFIAKFKAGVLEWPTIKTPKLSRPMILARFVLSEIRLYRHLLPRRGKCFSRDALTNLTATYIRIRGANELEKSLTKLPPKFTGATASRWWKVGLKILKRYWKDNPSKRDRDWKELGSNKEGKGHENYATSKVRKAFHRLADSVR